MADTTLAAELVFLSGSFRGRRVPFRHRVLIIGRDPGCDVVIDDQGASRRHAEIAQVEDGLLLSDLGSTNGTYLNDRRITEPTVLQNGDRLVIADTVLLAEVRPTRTTSPPTVVIAEDRHGITTRLTVDLNRPHFPTPAEGAAIPDAQRQLGQLHEFVSLVSGVLHRPALLERALDFLLEAARADRGAVLLLQADGSAGPQISRVGGMSAEREIAIPRGLVRHLVQHQQSFLSDEPPDAERGEPARTPAARSILAVPLKVKDRLLGILYLDRGAGRPVFAERDLMLCTAMGLHLAVCIENTALYEELLAAAEFNASLLRAITAGILVVDRRGSITRVNPAALEVLRQEESALLHNPITGIEALQPLAELITAALATGKTQDRCEISLRTREGVLPLGVSTALLTDHAGATVGVVAHFRNLAPLRRLEEQLRQSQHLALLGQMAAGVAHEIRNPLNSVRGFSTLIREYAEKRAAGTCQGAPCAEYAKIVVEEVDRMNRIVQDLLDYSRQRDLTLCALRLEAPLRDAVKEAAAAAESARVQVRLTLPPEPLPELLGSADKLRQVFYNVVLNAIQASPPGQTVEVSAALAAARPGRDVPEGADALQEIRVAVRDEGSGIPPEALPRIFDPFFTLKDHGVGLGLSISHKIITQHSGRIEAQSKPGEGTVFVIALPVPVLGGAEETR